MKSRIRHLGLKIGTSFVTGLLMSTPLLAQENGTTVVTEDTRSYALEVLIVLALVGGALYAVCKSSRRV